MSEEIVTRWDHAIATSGGNDSVALIQWAHEHRDQHQIEKPVAMYANTGWAVRAWAERISQVRAWVVGLGWDFVEIPTPGMLAVIRQYGYGYPPLRKSPYCSRELKIKPLIGWMDSWDPSCEAINMRGIRRMESTRRRDAPEWSEGVGPNSWRALPVSRQASAAGQQRDIWQPLVRHTDEMRDALVARTPIPLLPHRSRECKCYSARKHEIRSWPEGDIEDIRSLEHDAEIHFFAPSEHGGQVGIDNVRRWSQTDKGTQFAEGQISMCDTGWCGA